MSRQPGAELHHPSIEIRISELDTELRGNAIIPLAPTDLEGMLDESPRFLSGILAVYPHRMGAQASQSLLLALYL